MRSFLRRKHVLDILFLGTCGLHTVSWILFSEKFISYDFILLCIAQSEGDLQSFQVEAQKAYTCKQILGLCHSVRLLFKWNALLTLQSPRRNNKWWRECIRDMQQSTNGSSTGKCCNRCIGMISKCIKMCLQPLLLFHSLPLKMMNLCLVLSIMMNECKFIWCLTLKLNGSCYCFQIL